MERRGRLRKVVEDCCGIYIHTRYSIISPLTRPTRVLPTDIRINIITNEQQKKKKKGKTRRGEDRKKPAEKI